jgi:ABC-type microcin C transport system permease subunit YejE
MQKSLIAACLAGAYFASFLLIAVKTMLIFQWFLARVVVRTEFLYPDMSRVVRQKSLDA